MTVARHIEAEGKRFGLMEWSFWNYAYDTRTEISEKVTPLSLTRLAVSKRQPVWPDTKALSVRHLYNEKTEID